MATKKKDLENMSAKDRLWESLDYSYGQQRTESDKSYDRAKSEADRRALSRGMQRSSYNEQVQANLDKQKIDAQNRSYDAQNAAYASGLNQLEQQEKEGDRWERQFAEQLKQNEWSRNFQETAAQRAENQFNLQFGETQAQNAWQRGITERQLADTEGQNAWQRGITERQLADTEDQNAWQRGMTEKQFAETVANNDWSRNFQETAAQRAEDQWQAQFGETQAQNAWQRGITERQLASSEAQTAWQRDLAEREYAAGRADTAFNQNQTRAQFEANRADTAWNQNFQQAQANVSNDQWERQFGQNVKTTDQQIAMGYVQAALSNGQVPSDELLARAGLSRADAQAITKKAVSSTTPTNKEPWKQLGLTEEQYKTLLAGGKNPNTFDMDAFIAALSAGYNNQQYEPDDTHTWHSIVKW